MHRKAVTYRRSPPAKSENRNGVFRGPLCQSFLFFASQAQAQFRGNLRRNFFLHNGEIPVLAPKLPISVSVHQIAADREIISTLDDPSGQHGTHAQLPTYGPRIDVLAFVSEGRIARDHTDAGQLRETVDRTLGNAITQVIAIGSALALIKGSTGIESIVSAFLRNASNHVARASTAVSEIPTNIRSPILPPAQSARCHVRLSAGDACQTSSTNIESQEVRLVDPIWGHADK